MSTWAYGLYSHVDPGAECVELQDHGADIFLSPTRLDLPAECEFYLMIQGMYIGGIKRRTGALERGFLLAGKVICGLVDDLEGCRRGYRLTALVLEVPEKPKETFLFWEEEA